MEKEFYKVDHQKRKEAYLLAKGHPWLLWRLQAFRAGYTPPLLPGRIPQELVGVSLGPDEQYDPENLIKHANIVRIRERNYLVKMFTILMISMGLLIGVSLYLQFKTGDSFRIPIFETLIPQVSANQVQTQ